MSLVQLTTSDKERQFWTEFIEIYKENPCLWKIKSKEYSDRVKKNAAYDLLVEKLKEKDANATRELVTKKINNMRSSFRKECKKVSSSMKSGAGSDDVYIPNLWYYDLLVFLKNQEIPRTSVSSMEEVSETIIYLTQFSISTHHNTYQVYINYR
ncbi:UNVERIFIED_CONTAM: hypothetical protein GTU68_064100 [Idotea baltica]|nr:hypothetical protein [Idotea baltica]